MTVSLTGADDFYFVLGTYTGTAGPAGQSAAWNNEGKSTEGGLSAEAWGRPQLEKMLAITQKDHEVVDFYPQAQAIAMENDAAYAPREGSLTDEARWECPEHEEIEAKSKYTADELNGLAKDAIRQVYGLRDEALSLMEEVDDEPDFRFVMEGDTLMFHAWFALTQNPSDDPNEWPEWTAGDGQYVVVINSETGVVEDVIYDTCLNGNG